MCVSNPRLHRVPAEPEDIAVVYAQLSVVKELDVIRVIQVIDASGQLDEPDDAAEAHQDPPTVRYSGGAVVEYEVGERDVVAAEVERSHVLAEEARIVDAVHEERDEHHDEAVLQHLQAVVHEHGQEPPLQVVPVHPSEERVEVVDVRPAMAASGRHFVHDDARGLIADVHAHGGLAEGAVPPGHDERLCVGRGRRLRCDALECYDFRTEKTKGAKGAALTHELSSMLVSSVG